MQEFPILSHYDGDEELVTAKQFAQHVLAEFKYIDYVKSKNIKRCFMIFYDNSHKNRFFKKLKVIFKFHCGSVFTNVYEYKNVLIAISPLGAPAAASLMEELALFGIKEFIAVGSAGCLNESYKDKFILVDKAIRDEGLSYHYLKPSVFVEPDLELTNKLEDYLKTNKLDYVRSVTWTNDAFYRETKQKVEMAINLGAVAVEMECAAWCAVAKYRNIKFAQILYFSDVVKQESWSRIVQLKKGYDNTLKDLILDLVKDMAVKIS